MRAFMDKFFARHYFQVQDSLLSYMTSEEFLHILNRGNLRILEIGAGPAVTSLAVIDMLVCILQNLNDSGLWSNSTGLKINCILNDTSDICLVTGQQLLKEYFKLTPQVGMGLEKIVTLKKGFPENIPQLWQLCQHLGPYHIVSLSYILNPLHEQSGIAGIVKGFGKLEKICTFRSATLILQNKFSESLIRKVSYALGRTYRKDSLTQYVYHSQNSNIQQTYSYFRCLSLPSRDDFDFFLKQLFHGTH